MDPSHRVLTSPAPDVKIAPVHDYTEQQQAQIESLREVRTFCNFKHTLELNRLPLVREHPFTS